ncbi:MAG: GNAT family N-acetyltransferase [Spirochaetales bacterium]|nr:GNAT family N-acetyltransferase [Spirochaetales bacterium]
MGKAINYRLATTKDIGPLTEYRMAMLEEVGLKKNDLSDREMEELIQDYYKEHLCSGTFFAYVAESENEIIGISGATITFNPPNYECVSGKNGYIMNIYTDPAWRGKGIAAKMVELILDELIKHDVGKVWLLASEAGKPVYEKFGFSDKSRCVYMAKKL